MRDALGNIRTITDGSGNITESRLYSPYGEPYGGTGSAQTVYGFTGEPKDDATGFVHLRARYYNPSLGQFMNLDPKETSNRFAYVMGNPVNATDPSGLAVDAGGGGGGCNVFCQLNKIFKPIVNAVNIITNTVSTAVTNYSQTYAQPSGGSSGGGTSASWAAQQAAAQAQAAEIEQMKRRQEQLAYQKRLKDNNSTQQTSTNQTGYIGGGYSPGSNSSHNIPTIPPPNALRFIDWGDFHDPTYDPGFRRYETPVGIVRIIVWSGNGTTNGMASFQPYNYYDRVYSANGRVYKIRVGNPGVDFQSGSLHSFSLPEHWTEGDMVQVWARVNMGPQYVDCAGSAYTSPHEGEMYQLGEGYIRCRSRRRKVPHYVYPGTGVDTQDAYETREHQTQGAEGSAPGGEPQQVPGGEPQQVPGEIPGEFGPEEGDQPVPEIPDPRAPGEDDPWWEPAPAYPSQEQALGLGLGLAVALAAGSLTAAWMLMGGSSGAVFSHQY